MPVTQQLLPHVPKWNLVCVPLGLNPLQSSSGTPEFLLVCLATLFPQVYYLLFSMMALDHHMKGQYFGASEILLTMLVGSGTAAGIGAAALVKTDEHFRC